MKKNETSIKPYMRQFYRGNIGYLLLALVQTLFITAGALLDSWLIQQIVDKIGGADTGFSIGELVGWAGISVALFVIGCAISYVSKPRFIAKAGLQYKNYVFSELSKKGISAFMGENTSSYLSALSNDVNAIESGYLANIFTILDQSALFIGALVLMLWYNPLLTLISVAFAVLPVGISLLTGGLVERAEKEVSDRNESFLSTLRDCLVGFSVIKSFRAEKRMYQLFAKEAKGVADAKEHRRKMAIVVQACANIAGNLLQLGVFLVGAYLALSGSSISAGSVLVFVQLLNYVISPIGAIPQALAECKASKRLVRKVADALSTHVQREGGVRKTELKDGITVENLSFSYEPGKEVLRGIHFHFEAGKSYCLVGGSGSGKSTLLNLLMGTHPDYAGHIRYDDVELREIAGEDVYDMISLLKKILNRFAYGIWPRLFILFSLFKQHGLSDFLLPFCCRG